MEDQKIIDDLKTKLIDKTQELKRITKQLDEVIIKGLKNLKSDINVLFWLKNNNDSGLNVYIGRDYNYVAFGYDDSYDCKQMDFDEVYLYDFDTDILITILEGLEIDFIIINNDK